MTLNQNLSVVYRSVESLKPYAGNARTHSTKQLAQLKRSIEVFGFTNPVLIDSTLGLIAGHGRVEAAKRLGMSEVPTILLDHMNDQQKRAYIIADNKLAENAGWDKNLLALELGALADMDLTFDLSITGFDTGDIDMLLLSSVDNKANATPSKPTQPRSQTGDLWLLGKHRLLCGDATDRTSFERLLETSKAKMVFTDPPYNVPIDGHVCGKGSVKHAEFAMATGEMSPAQFTQFLTTINQHLIAFTTDGSLHYICMDWRHMGELLQAATGYRELKNLCVWNKTTGGMGSFYRSKHELVFVFKNGKAPHTNNVQLGKHGRNRTNVWDYAGVNSFDNKSRLEDLSMHPTVKPVQMIADAILDASKRNDLILDCFGGSGSTLIAAQETGRLAALIEFEPTYVDIIIQRFQNMTGIKAIHAETQTPFDDYLPKESEEASDAKS